MPRSRRGSAIVPALLVVVVVSTLSMIFLQLSLAKNKEQRTSVDTKRAFYMAEAGLSEAFAGLVAGKSGNVGSESTPARFANGLFFVTATERATGEIELESTGLCGAGRACLSIVVERRVESLGARGFFGDQSVTIETGSLVDSYDSRVGPYTLQSLLVPLGGALPIGTRVGCNGDITVTGGGSTGAKIYGDAKPGPSGTLYRARNATITGSTAPSTETEDFPDVEVPKYARGTSVTWNKSSPPFTVPPGDRSYATLCIQSGGKAIVRGPANVVVDALVVEGNGKLEFDTTNGPVNVYVKDWLNLASGSQLGSVGTDPVKASLQIAASETVDRDGDGVLDPPATLGSSGSFYGTMYAPNAALSVPNALQVYGAVSARDLTLRSGAKVHFDRALLDLRSAGTGLPEMMGWRLVELPSVPLVSLRYDALRALKTLGVTPTVSRDAHFDIGVTPF